MTIKFLVRRVVFISGFFFRGGWGSEKYSRCGMHDIYVYHNDLQFMDSYAIDVYNTNNALNVVSTGSSFIIFMIWKSRHKVIIIEIDHHSAYLQIRKALLIFLFPSSSFFFRIIIRLRYVPVPIYYVFWAFGYRTRYYVWLCCSAMLTEQHNHT